MHGTPRTNLGHRLLRHAWQPADAVTTNSEFQQGTGTLAKPRNAANTRRKSTLEHLVHQDVDPTQIPTTKVNPTSIVATPPQIVDCTSRKTLPQHSLTKNLVKPPPTLFCSPNSPPYSTGSSTCSKLKDPPPWRPLHSPR